MPTTEVNGATLHYEIRGSGPPALLVMGATGDGGHFDALAGRLADEFTVVSYDRRGNGRSPAPDNWSTTSPQQQADDAAALLHALGTGPAAVFGTSSGAIITLCLTVRHPGSVTGAVLHEPPLAVLTENSEPVPASVRTPVVEALQAGSPQLAVERFWRNLTSDEVWDQFEPELRARILASAGTLFGVEMGALEQYWPTDQEWDAIAPVRVLVSRDSLPGLKGIADRLASRVGVQVGTVPGTHAPYHDHPDKLADAIRPFFRRVAVPGTNRGNVRGD